MRKCKCINLWSKLSGSNIPDGFVVGEVYDYEINSLTNLVNISIGVSNRGFKPSIRYHINNFHKCFIDISELRDKKISQILE